MKRNSIVILVIPITLLLSNCQGLKGDKGDPGPIGQTGATGNQGLPGTANVIYSNWFSPSSWQGFSGSWYFDKLTLDITQNILDKGVVLVYTKDPIGSPNVIYPLPATFYNGVIYNYVVNGVQDLRIGTNLLSIPVTYLQYRYIIIPGGTQGNGRIKGPDYSNYYEVISFYNIPN